MDFETVAIGRGEYKNQKEKPAQALRKLGGAKTILATAPDGKSMTALIGGRRSLQGWPSGISTDSEDALRLCAFSGVRPMIETFPLAEAAAAYDRMMSGKARFRVVLKMT